MLAALALALGCAACTDRTPVLAEPEPEMELLGMLQCTADVRTLHMTCTEATSSTPGISPALFGLNQVKLASSNVAHDTATGIFRMDVTAQNLLSYAIGTPDGTTRAGLKVFFQTGPTASYYTLGDTGTVRVHNPSGYQNFTAAQQPYFHYDTILHPQEVAAPQRWEFSVPSTVKSFGFGVRVFTATQQENRVPMRAPEGSPAWFHDESRSVPCQDLFVGECLPNVVSILFHESATQEERQSAVDHIKGAVRGGRNGFYHVELPGDSTLAGLRAAIQHLRSLPQVRRARPFYTSQFTGQYLLPHDGSSFRTWKLHPDSAEGANWALEQIASPYGWGCSMGDSSITVAVIDDGFQGLKDLERQVDVDASSGFPTAGDHRFDHGTRIAAVLAGYGNDTSQVAGVMWRARLVVRNAALKPDGTRFKSTPGVEPDELWAHLRAAGEAGARVINLSVGWRWGFNPDTVSDPLAQESHRASVSAWFDDFKAAMDSLAAQEIRPLVVFAAGNESQVDARWNIGRIAADSSDQFGIPYNVLVVGASTRDQELASFSSPGTLVRIAAPGEDVTVLHGNGRIAGDDPARVGTMFPHLTGTGTSFAAPHVAGAAGLLFSFDPRLTAAQVKELILAGARRGNRVAGTVPILNIRESLILAGRRAGAPLCGNRLWLDETGMYAQRDTSLATGELLFPVTRSSSRSYYFDALHGGKEIQVQAGSRLLATWSQTGWTTATAAWNWEHPMGNGTWNSGNGYSHSGDTVFSVRRETHELATRFWPRLTVGSVIKELANPITRARRSGPPVCLSLRDSIRTSVLQPILNDGLLAPPYQEWRSQVDANGGCTTNGPPSETLESDAWYAYHPEGRDAYVFVSEEVGVAAVGAWTACTTKHPLNYVDPHDGVPKAYYFQVEGRCRNVETVRESATPAIFRVRLSTEAVTPHAFTETTIARGDLFYPALSEDGREVRWNLRDRTSRLQRNWTRGFDGVWSLSGWLDAGLTVTCTTQYRDFRTGRTTLTPPITCDDEGGIAANRYAAHD